MPYTIERVSGTTLLMDPFGSSRSSLSFDGRYVTFDAHSMFFGGSDVFVYDRLTQTTTAVSPAFAHSGAAPSISGDGRYIGYNGGGSGFPFVSLYDRVADTTVTINSLIGTPKSAPSISADGNFLAFAGDNFNSSGGGGTAQLQIYDRVGGTTQAILTNVTTDNLGTFFSPALNADGRYVAFSTSAGLVAGDTNNKMDTFVFDRVTTTVELVSVPNGGGSANNDSQDAELNADGRFVVYESTASNLVAGDTNGKSDIFLYDRVLHTTARISGSSNGTQGNGDSFNPATSGDGRYVAYHSFATNLVAGDFNNATDVFVYDTLTHRTIRASVAPDGRELTSFASSFLFDKLNAGFSVTPAISADGHFVSFFSDAANLIAGAPYNGCAYYVVDIQQIFANTTESFGGDNDDTLTGGITDDSLYGAGGSDRLIGGSGVDILDGGRSDVHVDWRQPQLARADGGPYPDIVDIQQDGQVRVLTSTGSAFNPAERWQVGATSNDRLADVSGDGRADLIQFYNGLEIVALSTITQSVQFGVEPGTAFGPWRYWASGATASDQIADVNGDGKGDLVQIYNGRALVGLSTGGNFERWTTWAVGATASDDLVDLNGDGRADLLQLYNGSAYAALSAGSAFGPWLQWTTGATAGDQAVDLNGDGRADLLQFYNGRAVVALSDGSHFGPWTTWAIGATANDRVADVNGDGDLDLLQFYNGREIVALSNGSGFGPWTTWATGATAGDRAVDLNADGSADLVQFYNARPLVALSTGSSFGAWTSWSTAVGASPGNDTLTGGADPDTFVFGGIFGDDVVTDFNVTQDRIGLDIELLPDPGAPSPTRFNFVLAHTADDGNGNAVITFDTGSITLQGIEKASLLAQDFVFG